MRQGVGVMFKHPIAMLPLVVAGVLNFFLQLSFLDILLPAMSDRSDGLGQYLVSIGPWIFFRPAPLIGGLIMVLLYLMSIRLTSDALMETTGPRESVIILSLKKFLPF